MRRFALHLAALAADARLHGLLADALARTACRDAAPAGGAVPGAPRDGFRQLCRQRDEVSALHFLRRGRGVSFHEFDLSMGAAERLQVVSSMCIFHRERRPLHRLRRWRHRHDPAPRWEALLCEQRPDLHPGFFQKSLDLILEKS